MFIPLEGILDPAQEKKLANEGFVKSAPAEVVEGERTKLQTQKDRVTKLKAALADLG